MDFDVIVIGSGPGGLTAGLYSKWLGMKTVIFSDIEKPSQLELATTVENIPGFKKISGIEYIKNFKEQIKGMGIEIRNEKVVDIKQEKDAYIIYTVSGTYSATSVIISSGAEHRKAKVPGEKEFLGRGVSYCATCDGNFFKGKSVVVWGGGDTAMTYAIYLASLGCKTTLVHRRKDFKASEHNVNKARESGVKFVLEHTVEEIKGDKMVKSVVLDDKSVIETSAVFIAIGETPSTSIFQKAGIKMDEKGFIVTNRLTHKTNLKGIFAVGDATTIPFRQVIITEGDAALAAYGAYRMIKLKESW